MEIYVTPEDLMMALESINNGEPVEWESITGELVVILPATDSE